MEDLSLYDNESWNDPKDFAKPVKVISLPTEVPNAFDRCLIELENQVQHLIEAHLAPKSSVQVNKIASSWATINRSRSGVYPLRRRKPLALLELGFKQSHVSRFMDGGFEPGMRWVMWSWRSAFAWGEAFGGNTRDLSIGEETEQDCNFTRRWSRFGTQCVETTSQSLVTTSNSSRDDVKISYDDFLIPSSKGSLASSVIARLVLAATCYFNWRERNSRLFKKKLKTYDQIYDDIVVYVRSKVLTFRFKKNSMRVRNIVDKWKLPRLVIIYGSLSTA
ncbi:hypothetical protein Tco_0058844 [Tanacetum coccineum]